MHRSAVLGCGPRANNHAAVYPDIDNMELVACCDLDADRCEAYASKHDIPNRYGDLQKMLDGEQIDVLHMVTQPNFRLAGIRTAAEAGVKAVIVEKPLTLWPMEALEIAEVSRETGCRIVVNTQRRYFPQYAQIRELIRSGRLGEVDFVRASTWGGPLAMGPHLMDLALMVLDDPKPESVWATAEGLEGYEWTHPAPSHVQATYWLPGNRRLFWECSPRGLGNRGGATYWMHLDLDIFCTKGVIWAQQKGRWGYQVRGEAEVFDAPADYFEQEHPGQRDFTAAVGTWLDDDNTPHECRLETALPVMWSIYAALKSAKLGHQITLNEETGFFLHPSREGRHLDVPAGVTDNDLKALRNNLPR
jgi:predicted dehydrogenase